MATLDLILLGIVIASNNLSFSFGLGALGTSQYHLKIILTFTLVEFTIPLIGSYIGSYLSSFISDFTEIVGSLILIGLGVFSIYSSFKTKKESIEEIVSF